MSYCRWSTDSFRCDLYCYESTDGYTTHVATNRTVRTPEAPLDASFALIRDGMFDEFTARHKVFTDWMDGAPREPIGGPFDGEMFVDPDLASFRVRLIELRAAGYNFPDSVLSEVDEELSGIAAPVGPEGAQT